MIPQIQMDKDSLFGMNNTCTTLFISDLNKGYRFLIHLPEDAPTKSQALETLKYLVDTALERVVD